MGQFVHAIRRNLNVVYIVMNNGCYGLTKGQDSATADEGSISKKGQANPFEAIDLASLAMELGATFVGRSFSGDKTQLIPLIKAALSHPGFAFLDVISPCVTFNNNKGSTKSYDYTREHIEATGTMDFVPFEQEITVDYPEGSSKSIAMHDGSIIELSKLANGWDPQDRMASFMKIQEARIKGQILTGLLYIDPETKDLHQMLNTTERSLNQLEANVLSPGLKSLVDINNEYR